MDKSKFKVGSNIKMNVWIDDESYPFIKSSCCKNKTTKFGDISCLKIKPHVMSGEFLNLKKALRCG